ncbi:GHMP kinase [Vibrio albus]|uniref:GHMP kinase n=1 Tax=Vibrio albus TaxID=2200953 RepID=A0A2U3B646_9VIBR|nr:GHMP kinase [Vibrio albus]PWI32257.1 GHMP kinase [Vibrio albus]
MTEATCPASCGELIQGWIAGSEKLVSCPINWFSTVAVTSGNANASRERPLMRRALILALETLGIPATESLHLKIDYDSDIPVAKGMASSTADIAATIAATYRHFKSSISEHKIARMCVQLEPSDSTMFGDLTLFDHHTGAVTERYGEFGDLDILVLESPVTIDTSAYHEIVREHKLIQSADALSKAAQQLALAIKRRQNTTLGIAATASAIESQAILPKPYFTELLELVEKYDLYGLNVAHSGSAVGLFYHTAVHDIERVIYDITHSPVHDAYTQAHQRQLIAGGIR